MNDIIIKKKNPFYREFFRSNGQLRSEEMIYSCNTLIFGYLDRLWYFRFGHKEIIQSALYEVLLKGKTIHLKFIKITGDNHCESNVNQ